MLFIIWCCVPSTQSKSQTSDDCDNLSAREETFLVKDGTPELVPKKVIFTYLWYFCCYIWIKFRLLVKLRQIKHLFLNKVILKLKNNYSKCCLISILFICVFQSESVFASREPIIRVLISKNNNLRIRSDRSIPLTIEGKFFSRKKIKGLTLKNEKNGKILYFDKNKQKKY